MKVDTSDTLGNRTPSGQPPAADSIEAGKEARNQEHFRTDHLLTNLKGHTISSGAVTVSAQGAKFVLSLISVVVLARLLTPRDFGLVAMVTTVTGLLRVFKDAGLSIATVQRERVTHAQISNLFWINVAVSTLSTLVIAAMAPVIAWFYRDPRLVPITLVLSTTYLISGSTIQHQALLKRQMRFKAIALIEVGSMTFGICVGVLMALLGYRYWALVGSTLSIETAALLLTWLISRWRPQLPALGSGTRPLIYFGANRTLSDLVFALARGTDTLLLGRIYGAGPVGLYSRATDLLMRPLEQCLSPIGVVLLPALSRLQSQPERFRSAFLRVYENIALIACPFAGLFLALSRPLILVSLGPRWERAAPIFGVLTIAALSVPLVRAAMWLFNTQGRGRDLLLAQTFNSSLTILAFVVGLPFGPVGVAAAFSLSGLLIRLPILYFIVGRRGPVRTADLWIRFLKYLPLWVVVFLVSSLSRALFTNLTPARQLLVCAPVGLLAGVAFICCVRPLRQAAMYLINTVRELKRSR